MEVEIKIVDYGSKEYWQAVELREKMLRIPLGMKFSSSYLDQDRHNIHIIAMDKDKVVGTVLLKHIDKDIVKVRQVATDYNYQGLGIARQLMLFAEHYARSNGYKKILLHARYYVVDFYEKLGYQIIGKPFIEVAMPHNLMIKKL